MVDYKVNIFYSDNDANINDIFTHVIVHEICKEFNILSNYESNIYNKRGKSEIQYKNK